MPKCCIFHPAFHSAFGRLCTSAYDPLLGGERVVTVRAPAFVGGLSGPAPPVGELVTGLVAEPTSVWYIVGTQLNYVFNN